MSGFRGSTLAVRFLCELGMLAALGDAGFTLGSGAFAWVLGMGAPLIAILIWGALIAPKARHPLAPVPRLGLEVILLGAAVTGLVAAGQPVIGVLLGALALTTSLLTALQEARERAGGG